MKTITFENGYELSEEDIIRLGKEKMLEHLEEKKWFDKKEREKLMEFLNSKEQKI